MPAAEGHPARPDNGIRKVDQVVPNVVVERSSAPGHNWVPITHWKNRIQDARFLPGR